MLASKLYSPTLRELPADAVVMSHKYMLKAGMMRKIANGTYAYLPLAFRAIEKVKKIIREEINKTGAQEILMPIVQPSEIWQKRDAGPYMERKCSSCRIVTAEITAWLRRMKNW